MIPEPSLIGRHHPLLTEFRRAFREGAGAALLPTQLAIEGPRLLDEAIRSGLRLEKVLFSQTGYDQLAGKLLPQLSKHVQTSVTDDAAFNAAMDAGHPQGVAALVRWEAATAEAVCSASSNAASAAPLILATALQDPGNLGTLVRAADAFGATGVLALAGTVSPLHPKAVRASAGSLFHLPVAAKLSPDGLIQLGKKHGIRILATVARGGQNAADTDFTQPICLIIGQEAGGVPRELLRAADGSVTIPTVREIDSLNAGVAGAILLYEAARQRGR